MTTGYHGRLGHGPPPTDHKAEHHRSLCHMPPCGAAGAHGVPEKRAEALLLAFGRDTKRPALLHLAVFPRQRQHKADP